MISPPPNLNSANQPQAKEKSKSRLLIILSVVVIVSVIILVLINLFTNKESGSTNNDFSAKSKAFIEAYGNSSYKDPVRNLASIQSFLDPTLYKSIQGDSANSQDPIYLSILNKSQFSIETKTTGEPTLQKTSKSYLVKVPVSEKSTQNGVSQTENKVYLITWSKINNAWQITDFGTTN